MSNEQQELRDFLAGTGPFEKLPQKVLDEVARALRPRTVQADERVLPTDDGAHAVYLIERGAVEVLDADGVFMARLGEGEMVGHQALMDANATLTVTALEETRLQQIPEALLQRLLAEQPALRDYLAPDAGGRLAVVSPEMAQDTGPAMTLMTTPLRALAQRAPVTAPPQASVREAAGIMTEQNVSSLLVVEGGKLVGILTDRDLRTRVIARARSLEAPVSDVMTTSPASIAGDSYAYEALLSMAHAGIHHLPVMDGQRILGMVTDTDLLQRQSASPLYVLGEAFRAESQRQLVDAARGLAPLLVAMVQANASARSIGYVVSSVGAAINSRLLSLAEAELGPAPVAYAWMAGGSLARHEQSARSDQDNCLLLSDDYDADEHGEYFTTLARMVCDGLDACGYEYCPGDVMAMTPRWRQPLATWKHYFDEWIEQPEPKALMHASIFFDLRCLYGDTKLFATLQRYVLEKAKENRLFHAYMAANALHYQPPLGFFRSFVLVKDGEHDRTLDLKHRGVVPITNVARVHALASGVAAVNTTERLAAAGEAGQLSDEGAADLRDAFEFISIVRLRHQARQLQEGRAADNFLSPRELSPFERKHLKQAFSIVSTMQSVLSNRYQTGRFG